MKNKIIIMIVLMLMIVLFLYIGSLNEKDTIAQEYLVINDISGIEEIKKDLNYYIEINDDIEYIIEVSDMLLPVTNSGNEKYFRKNIYNENDSMGTLFIDEISGVDNMIIQGHSSTINDYVFTQLNKFLENDYFVENPTFKIESSKGIIEYNIIGIKSLSLDTDNKWWYQGEYANLGDKEDMINDFINNSTNSREIEYNINDQLVTLVTCNTSISNGRYVIIASRII